MKWSNLLIKSEITAAVNFFLKKGNVTTRKNYINRSPKPH